MNSSTINCDKLHIEFYANSTYVFCGGIQLMSVDIQPKSYRSTAEITGSDDFLKRIDYSVHNSKTSGHCFLTIVLHIENWGEYCRHHDASLVEEFIRDLYETVRKTVKPDQYVCVLPEGLGLVFEGISEDMVLPICQRLQSSAQFVIRAGHYNDVGTRWADVLQRFLFPHAAELIYPQVGAVLSPRDGKTSRDILNRLHQRLVSKGPLQPAA